MAELNPPISTLDEIETRQDEVLRQLDELNLSLEKVLAEWLKRLRVPEPAPSERRKAA